MASYCYKLVFSLLVVMFPLAKGTCEDFPAFKSCDCKTMEYLGRDQYVLNCTNIGFKNVSVLSNLPEETEVLLFVGNNIPELPWNLFGVGKNLTRLRVIDMSNNNIRIIHGKSFHHVSTVERLILNHNMITITSNLPQNVHHPRMFSNFEHLRELHLSDAFADKEESLASDLHDIFIHSELKNLRKIHLEQNELTGFKEPNIFCELPSIMDLYLGNNKLEGIDFDIKCLPHLRFIDLENNHISVVSGSDMVKLDNAAKKGLNITLDLGGNPLLCGPQLEAFYSLLDCSKIQLKNKDKLRCKKTSDKDKFCSVVVTPGGCSESREAVGVGKTPSSCGSHILLATALSLSLITNAFFLYRRIWPGDPIGSWFRSFTHAFTSSAVHYTKQSNLDDL